MDSSTTEKEDSNLTFPKEDRSGCDNNDVQDTDRHGNIDLNDSEYTADSLINEPGSGMRWFGGIGTEFLNCLTDNVSPVVSGVATLVHKTAVAVANEISQLERDGELEAESTLPERFHRDCGDDRDERSDEECSSLQSSAHFDSSTKKKSENLILPWEICQENRALKSDNDEIPVYFTDKELMKRIFALSDHDSTFLEPFSDTSSDLDELQINSRSSYCSNFAMDEPRIKLIQRILDIDENLASVHHRLTGTSNSFETSFWKNYFFHCDQIRSDELQRRKKQRETTRIKMNSSQTKSETVISSFPGNEEKSNMISTKSCEDEESLIPVGSDCEQEDDSSYVIQSAPNTDGTFATTRSVDDDLVLVDTH